LRLYVPDMTLNCKRWWECSWEALNVMGNGKPFIPSIFADPPLPGVVAPARAPAIKQIFFFKEDFSAKQSNQFRFGESMSR